MVLSQTPATPVQSPTLLVFALFQKIVSVVATRHQGQAEQHGGGRLNRRQSPRPLLHSWPFLSLLGIRGDSVVYPFAAKHPPQNNL